MQNKTCDLTFTIKLRVSIFIYLLTHVNNRLLDGFYFIMEWTTKPKKTFWNEKLGQNHF